MAKEYLAPYSHPFLDMGLACWGSMAILDLYIYFRLIKMMIKNIWSLSNLALVLYLCLQRGEEGEGGKKSVKMCLRNIWMSPLRQWDRDSGPLQQVEVEEPVVQAFSQDLGMKNFKVGWKNIRLINLHPDN